MKINNGTGVARKKERNYDDHKIFRLSFGMYGEKIDEDDHNDGSTRDMNGTENIDEVQNEVTERYTVLKKINKRPTDAVWEAIDKNHDHKVAIKKICDAFYSTTMAQKIYREIIFLQELKGHENIVLLRNIINSLNKKHLYLVFEYVEANLDDVIRANLLQDIHKQYHLSNPKSIEIYTFSRVNIQRSQAFKNSHQL